MNQKILFIISLILASITTILFYLYMDGEKKKEAQLQNVNIVVAAREIPPKTLITQEMVTMKEINRTFLHPKMMRNIQDVVGKYARTAIIQDEPIMSSRLIDPNEVTDHFAYTISEGYRAITLSYNPVMGLAGLVQPGDRVDVVGTYVISNPKEGEPSAKSKIFIQDVQVLSVGTTFFPVEEGGERKQEEVKLETITLEVKPVEAEILTLAEEQGSIRLLLRPVNSQERVNTNGVTSLELLK
ncbi:Flp pilus assembly protein CpaB [Microaerobacter geothermalis]|uniref:Flp pilus assembly protein CpaB n=1 Tax=Microaerobacter geothermalis TaxID=674972 RepID=UPI001F1A5DD0|nr:Flp pilus assembly protein CpaB [Microaerobacter geothermalis]MCF6094188.1 Flp pilus assembly protein CpaB [Microaerobacter geothermalis]